VTTFEKNKLVPVVIPACNEEKLIGRVVTTMSDFADKEKRYHIRTSRTPYIWLSYRLKCEAWCGWAAL